jgi:hypothetical protein
MSEKGKVVVLCVVSVIGEPFLRFRFVFWDVPPCKINVDRRLVNASGDFSFCTECCHFLFIYLLFIVSSSERQ